MSFAHISILYEACLQALQIKPDGIYVDATMGGAGHSLGIAKQLSPQGRLICIDRDAEAHQNARQRLSEVIDRVTLIKSDFREIAAVIQGQGLSGVDGILFDLGVSSPQLDHAERGFSYTKDAPLDMRMDQMQKLSAFEVVNTWEQSELRRILFDYGEERYAPLIAAAIVRERERQPIQSTVALAELIAGAMPPRARREKQHPAKRSFQAIRIAVNDELGAVEQAMQGAIDSLRMGGRLAVISFHSLEDRIVKTAFARAAQGCTCPPDFPVCVCGNKPKVKLTPRKPILPSEQEIIENPRARSAKLRVCERV